VEHHWLNADQTLDVMLDKGEIDVYTALRPGPVTTGEPGLTDTAALPPPATPTSANFSQMTEKLLFTSTSRRPGSLPLQPPRHHAESHPAGTSLSGVGVIQSPTAL
jgi:hypothetical protein